MSTSTVGFAVADEDQERLAAGQDYRSLLAEIRQTYKSGTRQR